MTAKGWVGGQLYFNKHWGQRLELEELLFCTARQEWGESSLWLLLERKQMGEYTKGPATQHLHLRTVLTSHKSQQRSSSFSEKNWRFFSERKKHSLPPKGSLLINLFFTYLLYKNIFIFMCVGLLPLCMSMWEYQMLKVQTVVNWKLGCWH